MGEYGRVWESMGVYCCLRTTQPQLAAPAAYAQHSSSWRHQPPTHNTAPVGGTSRLRTTQPQLAAIFSYLPISSHTLSYLPIKKPPSTALPGLPRPPAASAARCRFFHHLAFSSLFRILVMVPVVEKPFTNGIKSISVLFSSNACRSPGSRVSTV